MASLAFLNLPNQLLDYQIIQLPDSDTRRRFLTIRIEAALDLLLCVVGLEHREQLRDRQKPTNPFARVQEFQVAAAVASGPIRLHDGTETDAVDIRYVDKIQRAAPWSSIEERTNHLGELRLGLNRD